MTKLKVYIGISLWLFSFSVQAMMVCGHRGARGLSPENSLPGFREALKHHVDAIDLDVVMTKDEVLVVYHDLVLSPEITRDGSGAWLGDDVSIALKHLTLEDLQAYDVGRIQPGSIYAKTYPAQVPIDGTRIPTLAAVIQAIKQEADYPVQFQIEIKTDLTRPDLSVSAEKMVMALNQIIEAEQISDRVKVQAYDWQCLLLLQQMNPEIETAYLTDIDHVQVLRNQDTQIAGQWTGGYLLKDYHDSIPEMIHALGGTWWDVEDIQLTERALKKAHQLGLKVAVWSYPDRTGEEIDTALIERLILMGVDGVITDRPDLVKALLLSLSRNQH